MGLFLGMGLSQGKLWVQHQAGTKINIYHPAETTTNIDHQAEIKINIYLEDTNEDHASTQGVFGPGPGFRKNLRNDYHWSMRLGSDVPRTISSILIEHDVSGEAWTTSSSRRYGKDLYPVVVLGNGKQLNYKYDDYLGPFPAGDTDLELYGQIESFPFRGGKAVIEFSDGSSAEASIEPSALEIQPLDASAMECTDSDEGANYNVSGTVTYRVGDGKIYTYIDHCFADDKVAEGMCGGNDGRARQFVISHGVCSGPCVNGACVAGENKSDFEGAIRPVANGWEFTFTTGRQRSVEFIFVAAGMKEIQLNAEYQGRELKIGNGGDSHVFEPGRYTFIVHPAQNATDLSSGQIWIVFTDGTRFIRSLNGYQ